MIVKGPALSVHIQTLYSIRTGFSFNWRVGISAICLSSIWTCWAGLLEFIHRRDNEYRYSNLSELRPTCDFLTSILAGYRGIFTTKQAFDNSRNWLACTSHADRSSDNREYWHVSEWDSVHMIGGYSCLECRLNLNNPDSALHCRIGNILWYGAIAK